MLVLSYGLLARDVERLAAMHFATIVFDEAQVLKNATTPWSSAATGTSTGPRPATS